MVNMGLQPGTLPGIALTEHTQFDVARPAQFSTFQRGYRARKDGTITKFIAFGMARDKAGIKDWYTVNLGTLGENPLVREHVFGVSVGKVIKLGMVGTLPAEGQLLYDWNMELWFDSNDDAIAYLDSPEFKTAFGQLRDVSTDTLAGLFRGQEMLILNTALPHVDE
jgi:hypothetical protein